MLPTAFLIRYLSSPIIYYRYPLAAAFLGYLTYYRHRAVQHLGDPRQGYRVSGEEKFVVFPAVQGELLVVGKIGSNQWVHWQLFHFYGSANSAGFAYVVKIGNKPVAYVDGSSHPFVE